MTWYTHHKKPKKSKIGTVVEISGIDYIYTKAETENSCSGCDNKGIWCNVRECHTYGIIYKRWINDSEYN